MNFLFFHQKELISASTAELSGVRAQYVHEFHKLKEGETSQAILGGVGRGSAKCLSASKTSFTFEVDFHEEEKASFPLTLVQGLSRPQTIKKVLQFGAMFRVERIILAPTFLGEKSYQQSKILNEPEQMYEMIKGLEQVGNPFSPEVSVLGRFNDLFSLKGLPSRKFVACPGEPFSTFGKILGKKEKWPESAVLAIGPEPGWSEQELHSLDEAGYESCSLGADHLRVEVALVSLLSQLSLWRDVGLAKESESSTPS